MRNARALAVSAVAGVVVLVLANRLGLGVEISLLAVLVCALAGVPGAVLVVLLAYLEVAFVATVVPALALA
ncbi:MAG: pro-sigmaK processing inhibitor BofA family protein [Haloferacaceae archaeon]